MEKLCSADYAYPMASPQICFITADMCLQALKLKQGLENKGCQVYWTDASSDGLATACQKYFDLIVLYEALSNGCGLDICQRIKAYPELAHTPIVALETHDPAEEVVNGLKAGLIYYVASAHKNQGDACAVTRLLHTINQVCYLTDRYM